MSLINSIVKRGKIRSIKSKIDIIELLNALGYDKSQAKVYGKEYWSLCPNPSHRDSSPSWSINIDPEDDRFGTHNCFSCGYSGNFITLTKNRLSYTTGKQVTNEQALEFIVELFTLNTIDEDSLYDLILEEREQLYNQEEIVDKIIKGSNITLPEEFEHIQAKNKQFFEYMTLPTKEGGRGISLELLQKYKIGFCRRGTYSNRVIIPFYQKGELLSFVARSIFPTIDSKKKDKEEFKICPECGKLNKFNEFECIKCYHDIGSYVTKKQRSRYPKGSRMEVMLWPFDEVDYDLDYVILVEGAMDKLRLDSFGYKNVLCLFGNKISDTQVELLIEIEKNMDKKLRIFLFPDGDEGGDTLIDVADSKIKYTFQVFVVELPFIEDNPLDPGNASLKQIKTAFNKAEKLYKVCMRKFGN